MKPQMPKAGDNTLNGIYRTVKQIVDYIPSLEVTGDNLTTTVDVHSSGRIVRAKPQVSAGKAGCGTSVAPSTYDGMWAFSDYYNEDNIRYLRIKSGIFNRNGYFIRFNGPDEHPSYFEIPWSSFRATTQTYYIWIYQNWNYQTKLWELPQIRYIANNVMAMPEQDSPGIGGSTVIEGWALLGWVQPDRTKQWTCMETNIPIMIAAGNCMYNIPIQE